MSLVPKIKIDITFEELCEVCDKLSDIVNISFNGRTDKIIKNVLELVTIKLLKKQLSKRHTPKFTLTLEYYEAHFLEVYLLVTGEPRLSIAMLSFISKLNQKLA